MSGNLTTRVERLETKARVVAAHVPKLVRLCITDEDVADVYRLAKEMRLDTGPDSNDIFVIRLVPLAGALRGAIVCGEP